MISPQSARINACSPRGECARVASTHGDPWHILCIALGMFSKRKLDLLCKIGQVLDGILQREILHVVGGELCHRSTSAPVTMLENNGRSANLLSKQASRAVCPEIAVISGGIDFSWREENHRRARALPIGGIIVVELVKGSYAQSDWTILRRPQVRAYRD